MNIFDQQLEIKKRLQPIITDLDEKIASKDLTLDGGYAILHTELGKMIEDALISKYMIMERGGKLVVRLRPLFLVDSLNTIVS